MFIVDDILLAQIVLPYGQRLFDKNRETLYSWVDKQLGDIGHELVKRWRKRNPSSNDVLNDLGQFAEQNPEVTGELAASVFTIEADDVSNKLYGADNKPLSAGKRDALFLDVVLDYFIVPVVEMVKQLGHPAVVPGFLTGTDYLTVIDVRTPNDVPLAMPVVFGSYGGSAPTLRFPNPLSGTPWSPRLWLVNATDERRHKYSTLAQETRSLKEFANELKGQGLVREILRTDVVVRTMEMPTEQLQYLGDSWTIPWERSPDGVVTMYTALAEQLGERLGQDRLWIKAIAGLKGGASVARDR